MVCWFWETRFQNIISENLSFVVPLGENSSFSFQWDLKFKFTTVMKHPKSNYTHQELQRILPPFPYIKTLLEVSDHVFKKIWHESTTLKINDVNFLIYKDCSFCFELYKYSTIPRMLMTQRFRYTQIFVNIFLVHQYGCQWVHWYDSKVIDKELM